ncbi:MAG: transketolase [Proteobacteria bacterium]|nr:transketolase [Pseudomonadota bacterium]MBU1585381.1 transketolase [Pseudomonadota bacterium]MBU2456263.1 transketolase [Pseudomonadota bacterium]MBU2629146.1 transketolase [Pseudomonadota bacterium]
MRNAFAQEMKDQAGMNDKIVLLSGDIGNKLFDSYKENYADRFFNCGVAEANMTSMAAGMALNGLQPVTYTITPFNTSRCYEQIKIDICYHNLPVIVVGVGAGLSYAGLGATHHSFEDIAIMRVLPNMHIMCPCDAVEVKLCLRAALALKKPVYIRLGKKNEPIIHKGEPDLILGKGLIIKEGKTVCLLGCGNILPNVYAAGRTLENLGISTRIVSMHTVKPLDSVLLKEVFSTFEIVCTIEEHSLIGGFGSAVAEWVIDNAVPVKKFYRFGIKDSFTHKSGNQENARKMNQLTPEDIVARIMDNE